MNHVLLPDGERFELSAPPALPAPKPFHDRMAYAAAHVVADPRAENVPGAPAALDWDATLAFRHHLWRHGFGVAEAMDTAQRGMGLDYPATRELIRRTAADARGPLVAGVGTDQLPPGLSTLESVAAAYEEQLSDVEETGATPVLMCSRQLAAVATDADDYLKVYSGLLSQCSAPVVLHWLGDMFDPALHGYWGSADLDEAAETVLALIREHPDRVDGIKVSLLDEAREVALRRQLPPRVRLYTGDDFHYPQLIVGDELGYSDALLGIFDAIAPVAAAALEALDRGDVAAYRQWMAPTVPLSRHIFEPPTYSYKTGIVFLAYLNGHQRHFRMVAGQESARSVVHLSQLFRLAADAGLLADPKLAVGRMKLVLALAGVT